jgi:hypothetical protein
MPPHPFTDSNLPYMQEDVTKDFLGIDLILKVCFTSLSRKRIAAASFME